MTICVSAICQNGTAAVFATDRLLTAGFLVAEFEHPGGKSYPLSKTCVGLAAGDALCGDELFRGCQRALAQLQSPTVAQIAEMVRGRFAEIRLRRSEETILRPRGLTLREFYQDGLSCRLPTEMAFGIDQGIQGARLPLQVMVAGIDGTGGHLFGINDPGTIDSYDRIGYQAVGSGETHALLMMVAREHNVANDLRETSYLVYEAKRKAEVAPGVGSATEMGVISPEGVYVLTAEAIEELKTTYEEFYSADRARLRGAIDELGLGKERATDEKLGSRGEGGPE